MEPSQYLRLLKRRWLVLFVFVAMFAALGYASTLLEEEDTAPEIERWTAGEILVIDQNSERVPDLQRVAIFATAGSVPETVAQQLGVPVEELAPTLRTVSDRTEGKIFIYAVADSAEEARDVAQMISDELLVEINIDAEVEYQEQLVKLALDVDERLREVTTLDATIDLLLGVQDADVELTAAQADDLRRAQASRETALSRLAQAEEALETLEEQGAPEPALRPLDSVVPFRISEREYNSRIAEGRQSQNNFDAGEVSLADTSRPTVSERLESPAARAVLGALAGLVLGIMAVLVHARLDPRIRSKEQAEDAFDLPVIADIPVIGRKDRKKGVLHARDSARSSVAEAYRYLRSVLLFSRAGAEAETQAVVGSGEDAGNQDGDVRVVMVTSAGQGEGKTTTAANLAVLMAEAGHDTVLINCDFRLPSAHKFFGVEYEPGVVHETTVPKLRFISDVERTDDDTPGQISERQRTLIRRARQITDLVILDTAPVLATNDAIDVLPETDLVVLVAKEAKTTKDAAHEARELLIERMGVPVAGVVLTAAGAGLGTGYYEKYRYGNYFDKNKSLWSVGREASKQKKDEKLGKPQAAKLSRKERKAAKKAAEAEAPKPRTVVPDEPTPGSDITALDKQIAQQMSNEDELRAQAQAQAAAEVERLAAEQAAARRRPETVPVPPVADNGELPAQVRGQLDFDVDELYDSNGHVERGFRSPEEIDLRLEDRLRTNADDN